MQPPKLFLYTIFTILILLLSTSSMLAWRQNSIAIRFIGKDAGTGIDTIYCGFGYGNNIATLGIDIDSFYIPQYGVKLFETALPPIPPAGVFDFRFIDSNEDYPALDQGINNNFHPLNFTAVADTFNISLRSSVPVNSTHPFLVKWVLPTNVIVASCRLEYYAPALTIVDMLETDSVLFTKSATTSFLIFIQPNYLIDDIGKINYDHPTSFSLNQNYPNPFNPTTSISFSLPEQAVVGIKIYNTLGIEVATLVDNKTYFRGNYQEIFKGNNLPSGVYYYRISADITNNKTNTIEHRTETKKMILAK